MKPKVDVTETDGARWTMGKLVSDALGERSIEQNEFLSEFNAIAVEKNNDDAVLRVLLKWAVLVYNGEIVEWPGDGAPAKVEIMESEVSGVVAVVDDAEQLQHDAVEYLAGIETVDVENVGYVNTVTLLADVKDILGQIKAKRLALSKGARETIAAINDEFKPAEDIYARAEGILKGKLVEFRADTASIRSRMLTAGEDPIEPVPEVEGVIVKEKWDITVDKNDLPIDFLVADIKAIEAALKKDPERSIPGVIAIKVETLAVEHKKVKR